MPRRAEQLRVLDRLAPPDLWSDIRVREPRPPSEEPTGIRRALVAAVALTVAAGGIAFAVRAFEVTESPPGPAATITNGKITFSTGPDADLYDVEPDGTGLRKLVDRHYDDQEGWIHAAWSPDGTRLAFTDYTGPNDQRRLFVVEPGGGQPVAASGFLSDADAPAWSPDGTALAFTGFEGATGYEIYLVGVDGSGLRSITDERDNGVDGAHMPAWSPDGTRIAYSVNRYKEESGEEDQAIVMMNSDGSQQRRLSSATGVDESPVWSPDGSRIAFVRKTGGSIQAWVVGTGGEEVRVSSETVALTSLPAWSPDGRSLLFAAQRKDTSNLGIWVVNADGSGGRALLEDADVGSPVWSPDGEWIAFVRDDAGSGRHSIWVMRPDGSKLQEVAGGFEQVFDLAWQPVPPA